VIAGVRGTLEATGVDWVVLAVGGFSVRVSVPASTLTRLPPVGQPVHLLTYLYLREDQIALYGFGTPEERELFEQLIGVTGVGPRLALAILSAASSDVLRQAIASESVETLTRVPGIGRKLASRLILELRGKLAAPVNGTAPATARPIEADVLEALVGLGYSPADAQAALRSLPPDRTLDLEEQIRLALRYFAKR
jgi:Holliday junction DNA helicase RuvA